MLNEEVGDNSANCKMEFANLHDFKLVFLMKFSFVKVTLSFGFWFVVGVMKI